MPGPSQVHVRSIRGQRGAVRSVTIRNTQARAVELGVPPPSGEMTVRTTGLRLAWLRLAWLRELMLLSGPKDAAPVGGILQDMRGLDPAITGDRSCLACLSPDRMTTAAERIKRFGGALLPPSRPGRSAHGDHPTGFMIADAVRYMSVHSWKQPDSHGHSGTSAGQKQQPASPGKSSSRAISAGSGRCWVRTNVGEADGFTDRSLWPLGQPAWRRPHGRHSEG
jgi:hypothetical protein